MTNEELIEKLREGHPFEVKNYEEWGGYFWVKGGHFVGLDCRGYAVIQICSRFDFFCVDIDDLRLLAEPQQIEVPYD